MRRLSDVGFNNLNFAVEYFLAECVVREKVPSFLRDKRRSCPVCKFYDPIHAKEFAELQKRLKSKAKGGKVFTALLHPTREGGYWCEIPAFAGCCSQGSTLEEAKHMIKDAALGWLDMDEVRLRYRVETRRSRPFAPCGKRRPASCRRKKLTRKSPRHGANVGQIDKERNGLRCAWRLNCRRSWKRKLGRWRRREDSAPGSFCFHA